MPEAELRELTAEEWPGYFRGLQPLWGGGLAEEPFVAYQRRLVRSPEAAGRYRVLGLLAAGELLSAFKAYELQSTAGLPSGRPLRVLGIGAVFTPPELRRRGHGSAMLARALEVHARSGVDAALLFSDIGSAFYERLGFRLLESTECLVEAARLPSRVGFRPATAGDEARIAALLAASRGGPGFSLSRDGWVLRFQLRRLRELARARNVGEPEWGILVEERFGHAAALVRLARDAVDLLDAGWTTDAAREALFGGLRECCSRSRRDLLRLWPSHQLRGLYPEVHRPSALGMLAPLQPGVEVAARADLALLDHI